MAVEKEERGDEPTVRVPVSLAFEHAGKDMVARVARVLTDDCGQAFPSSRNGSTGQCVKRRF